MRYLKYIGICLLDLILYILAFIIFPIAYVIKPESGFFWWFLHSGNMYGYSHEDRWKHYGKKNFFVAYVWNVIRNSHWNFRVNVLKPRLGEAEKVKIKANTVDFDTDRPMEQLGMEFRTFGKPGKQWAEYSKGGSDYFRWSSCREVNYLGIKRIRSMMFGWNNKRPLFKIRHRKLT
ncbi:hypothetical protein [Christiangramia crocea]|uniref:Uncharacterized protein n=1 Tax=Christiangramia crocea TaxID=2904124 RepID=A0A9X2A569_9FLAO|nr:hypothetical protein [Gramella crocea]MCG9970980.1 hypothetical protein [Gramella crocea]